jgi:hypothetical protein
MFCNIKDRIYDSAVRKIMAQSVFIKLKKQWIEKRGNLIDMFHGSYSAG